MKNLFSKSPLILAFALLFILPIISFSQNVNSKSSIQVLEYSKIKFNSEEQRLYDLYASKDLYSSHILINSKVLPSLHRMGKLALKLPSLEMEVQSYTKSLEAEDENNYTWITEFIELGGEAILICEKGKLYGSISYFDKNYKVISIKEGVSMILLLDKEKLKDIETCRNDKKSNNTLISTPSNYYRDPCTVIDLLVMYTDNAATALGGVSAVIQEANTLVTTMNLAYSNSDMNGSINLVGVQNLDGINESVTALAVVTEFAIDGASAKDIANADLALLIYDSNAPDGIVGFAQGIGPPNSFSVVDEAFVNTTLVGVHEVGI